MSRIHEALKKAEQERGLAAPEEGALDEPKPPLSPEAASAAPEVALPSLSQVTMPTSTPLSQPQPVQPLSLQQLLEACPYHEWRPSSERLLFCNSHNGSVGSEQFRTLRTRLYQIRQKQELRTVLISSPLPADGKTFVAGNLAQVIVRQRGRRVLLIDGDLRRSQMHSLLGAPSEPGLSDYLRGDADEFAVIQRGPLQNLFFIPGGKLAPNPTELLASGRLRNLLQRVSGVFDWVVLDSPPAVPVSDPSLIAEVCDGVLLVLQAAVTPLEMAQKALQEFRNKPLVGVVLNRAEPRSTYGQYYYAEGHYRSAERKSRGETE
jgi:protein-tyrosine kinase